MLYVAAIGILLNWVLYAECQQPCPGPISADTASKDVTLGGKFCSSVIDATTGKFVDVKLKDAVPATDGLVIAFDGPSCASAKSKILTRQSIVSTGSKVALFSSVLSTATSPIVSTKKVDNAVQDQFDARNCDGKFTDDSGVITKTPGANKLCVWNIDARSQKKVEVTVETFEVGMELWVFKNKDCSDVPFLYAKTKEEAKSIISETGSMTILFRTTVASEFKAKWALVTASPTSPTQAPGSGSRPCFTAFHALTSIIALTTLF